MSLKKTVSAIFSVINTVAIVADQTAKNLGKASIAESEAIGNDSIKSLLSQKWEPAVLKKSKEYDDLFDK